VAKVLANDSKIGRQMRANMLPISLPDAAMRTAREVLEMAVAATSSPSSERGV
jgi:hypothetical protein